MGTLVKMMFRPWEASLSERISVLLQSDAAEFCDLSPGYLGSVYVANDRDKAGVFFAEVAGCGVYRGLLDGEVMFSFPFGGGEKTEALLALADYCREAGLPLRFYPVGESEIARLEAVLGGDWNRTERAEAADYIYDSERLVSLQGLPEARRAIRKFEAQGPWRARDAVPEDVTEMLGILERWTAVRGGDDGADRDICRDAVNGLGLAGTLATVIEQNGRIVSFEIGRWLNPDMLVAEFEKNDPCVSGGCQIANREFVRRWAGDARFVNRTCDLGSPGLAMAKRLYRPCRMVRKFSVTKVS